MASQELDYCLVIGEGFEAEVPFQGSIDLPVEHQSMKGLTKKAFSRSHRGPVS